MVKLQKLAFLLLVLSLWLVPLAWGSQTYDYTYDRSFGSGYGLPRDTRGGESVDLVDVNISANGDSFLGCSGLDFDKLIKATFDFENIGDQMKDYFQTAIANYLLTTLYNNPAVAAIFDSLEAFGNARMSLLQAKCNASEIRQAANERHKMTDQAINECLEDAGGDPLEEKRCLDGRSSGEQLHHYLSRVKADFSENNSIHELLGIESICGKGYDPTNAGQCPLLIFVPNISWCGSVGIDQNPGCQDKHSDAMLPGPEIMANILNSTLWLNETLEGFQKWVAMVGKEEAKKKAIESDRRNYTGTYAWLGGEGYPEYKNQVASENIVIDFNNDTKVAEAIIPALNLANAYFAQSGNSSSVEDFKRFMFCQKDSLSDELQRFQTLVESNSNVSSYEEGITDNMVEEMLGVLPDEGEEALKYSTIKASIPTVAEMLQVAANCTYNHQYRLASEEMVELTSLPSRRAHALIKAVRNEIAYLGTQMILRFMKHKVLEAHATVASGKRARKNGDEGDADIPEYMIASILSISDMYENQILALQTVHEQSRVFNNLINQIKEEVEVPGFVRFLRDPRAY